MISVCFQGKTFNITAIQGYVPTTNAEEAIGKPFYENVQDILEITPKKDVLLNIKGAGKQKKEVKRYLEL